MSVSVRLVRYAGGKDNLVKLWDAKTGKELHSLLVDFYY